MLDSNHIAYLSESIVTLAESIFVTSLRIFSFSQLISVQIFQNVFPNHLNNFKVALVCVLLCLIQPFWHIDIHTFIIVWDQQKH